MFSPNRRRPCTCNIDCLLTVRRKEKLKVDCPRRELNEAVSMACLATGVRSPLTLFQNLKLSSTNGQLKVLGCDGEMWIERTLACSTSEAGAALLPAKVLAELTKQLPDGDVNLTWQGNQVTISEGDSVYQLMALDAEDFPEPPNTQTDSELTIGMGAFKEAVDSVLFAVSSDAHRQALTGVYFSYDGSTLMLVATDTHRLAVRKLDHGGIGGQFTAIVPEKAIRAIKALSIPDLDNLTIRFGGNRLTVETSGTKIVSLLYDGPYPNWQRVVPSEHTRVWSVETDKLREVVNRARIVAKDSANRVRFSGAEDKIVLLARGEQGEANEVVDAVMQNGTVDMAFNGQYVQEALGPIKGPGVRIEITESTRPAVFRSADDTDSYFCVIMPMALA